MSSQTDKQTDSKLDIPHYNTTCFATAVTMFTVLCGTMPSSLLKPTNHLLPLRQPIT